MEGRFWLVGGRVDACVHWLPLRVFFLVDVCRAGQRDGVNSRSDIKTKGTGVDKS